MAVSSEMLRRAFATASGSADKTTVQLPTEAVPHYEAALEIVRRLGVRRPWQPSARCFALLWRSPSPPLCNPPDRC